MTLPIKHDLAEMEDERSFVSFTLSTADEVR